jgi:hypothetical protein
MGAYSDRVIADGASNYWRLGEPSGLTAVDLVGGKTGTISGGVTLGVSGALTDGTTGMTFDGTSGKVAMPATALGVTAFSFEAWFKSTSTTLSGLVTKSDASAKGRALVYDGHVRFWVYTAAGAPVFDLSTVPLYNDGTWHHAVGTWDGTTTGPAARVYVDGALVIQTPPAAGAADDTKLLLIGSLDPGAAFFFNGSLDDIAIYPRPLTAAEVAAHYLAGKSSLTWPGFPSWVQVQGGKALENYNVWTPITPSDTVDLPRGLTGGIWVGGSGDIAVVMQNNVMPVVIAAVPTGAWLPLAAKRINATLTTATNLVALYEV